MTQHVLTIALVFMAYMLGHAIGRKEIMDAIKYYTKEQRKGEHNDNSTDHLDGSSRCDDNPG